MRILLIACVLIASIMRVDGAAYISPTKYDYTKLSQSIVGGANSKYDQAKAIFLWLCDNILYDVTYQIHSADECFDNKRGVCQGYCELFYRLAEPLGLHTEIIFGKSKNADNTIASKGHAWLLVEVENRSIFIEPTWGAGAVNDGVFVKNDNPMPWFDVDPYWLIFNHFPDEAQYQMISPAIDIETFKMLPNSIKPLLGDFGINPRDLYNRAINGKLRIPQFYDANCKSIKVLKMPLTNELRVGRAYEFVIAKKDNKKFALINKDFTFDDQWQQDGNVRSIKFVPTHAGTVALGVNMSGNSYTYLFSYTVPPPNKQELAALEQSQPFLMPELTNIKGYDVKQLKAIGVDGHELLRQYRAGKIAKLPQFTNISSYLKVVDVPLSGVLKRGKSYIFAFKPRMQGEWVIIVNSTDFRREWIYNNGLQYMKVTPNAPGKLSIALRNEDDGMYYSVLIYEVE